MKRLLTVVAALGCALAIILLREQTMSRHVQPAPDSRSEVVVHVSTHGPERAPEDRAQALVGVCQLEVESALVDGSLRAVGDGDYSFAVQPALDASDQRQLHGCLEDAIVDHVQARVLTIRQLR